MLRKLFGFLSWHMTLLVVMALWLVTSLAFAVAQEINPFQNNVYAIFADPVMFSGIVVWLSARVTELVIDALKDRNTELRGWHTRLLTAGVASLLAGVGGFLGLSYFTELSGLQGAYTAASLALASWVGADFRHRAGQLRKTGMRKETRQTVQKELATGVVDGVLQGLLVEAKKLPPPYGLAASLVERYYREHGEAFVKNLIAQQRAASVEEAEAHVRSTQQDRMIDVKPATETGGV